VGAAFLPPGLAVADADGPGVAVVEGAGDAVGEVEGEGEGFGAPIAAEAANTNARETRARQR